MKIKRWIAALLCVLLIGSLFPVSALAAYESEGNRASVEAVEETAAPEPRQETESEPQTDKTASPATPSDAMPMSVYADDIASGTGWNLDADGVLHITGTISSDGFILTDEQKQQVKSAVAASGASISSGYSLFYEFRSMVSADLSLLNTTGVTNMRNMFSGCISLTSLDVSGFKTYSLMYAEEMFRGCSALTSLGIRPDILSENADDIIAIRSPWQKQGSTDTYSTADELKAVTDTVTLLAMYTVNVQNDGNGTASANPAAAVKGDTVTLTATPNTGYHFKEWQSSDVTVNSNSFTMPKKDVTVKAIFEADALTHTVTFNANGGSVTPVSAVTGADGKIASLPVPTRRGSYSFSGWYTAASGGTRVTVDKVYTADTTIHAHWTYTDGGGGSSYSESSSAVSGQTYSPNWFCDGQGVWRIRNRAGQIVTNAWLCDDVIKANGQNVWYLLGQDGTMVSAGLIQDNTGNFYSLEAEHNGYFGMLRYQNGTYNCNGQQVYLTFNQEHNGSFGAITNAEGLEKLKAIYGVTQNGIGNENAVYTASF